MVLQAITIRLEKAEKTHCKKFAEKLGKSEAAVVREALRLHIFMYGNPDDPELSAALMKFIYEGRK